MKEQLKQLGDYIFVPLDLLYTTCDNTCEEVEACWDHPEVIKVSNEPTILLSKGKYKASREEVAIVFSQQLAKVAYNLGWRCFDWDPYCPECSLKSQKETK